jgi:hypothetical protein
MYVFDENGDFGLFIWNDKDAWESSNRAVLFAAPAGNPLAPKGAAITLYPTLALAPNPALQPVGNRAAEFPRNGSRISKVACPLPVGPSNVEHSNLPAQRITYDSLSKMFDWDQPPERKLRLKFEKAKTQDRRPHAAQGESWGDTFKGQTLAQVEFPFLGYDPRLLQLYDRQGASTSGTNAKLDGGTTLSGTPIFAYPALESGDYVRSTLKHSPFLPLGAFPFTEVDHSGVSHTEILSSLSERSNSWSLNLGLSGGIPGLGSASVSGAYSGKNEEQKKDECRYTVSRNFSVSHLLFIDVPNMLLHEDFVGAIKSQLQKYIEKKDVVGGPHNLDWKSVIDRFGTHYAHAITFGSMDFMETRYSLHAETKAWERGTTLKQNAEVTMEGFVKAGRKVGASFNWGGKVGSEISKEDVVYYGVGNDNEPMPIFFDLRPISELLNPLFFPCDLAKNAKDLHAVAPFVWGGLRRSLERHLEKLGLNKPLDPSASRNYAPRIVKVVFDYWNIWISSGTPRIYGDINLKGINGVNVLQTQTVHVDKANPDHLENGSGTDFGPRANLSITLAATPAMADAGAGFEISGCLYDWWPVGADQDIRIPQRQFELKSGNRGLWWVDDLGRGGGGSTHECAHGTGSAPVLAAINAHRAVYKSSPYAWQTAFRFEELWK